MTSITVTISAWSAWAPGLHSPQDWQHWARGDTAINVEDQPDVTAVPAMLRRRLGSLGKLALSCALPMVEKQQQTPCVLVSRHGDLKRTLTLLEDLAQQQPLSPTQFSLSVHNAIGGLLSIHRHDPSSVSALACGTEDIATALLEAQAILTEQRAAQVLCLIYDEPVPELYRQSAPQLPDCPYAAAFLLSDNQAGNNTDNDNAINVQLSLESATAVPQAATEPQTLSFLRWLLSDEPAPLTLPGQRNAWVCQRMQAL